MPVVDDKPLLDKSKCLEVAGSDISNFLIPEVDFSHDIDRSSPFARQKLDTFKESNCFVAFDFEAELKRFESEEVPGHLSDSNPWNFKFLKDSPIARKYKQKTTNKAFFEAPEVLFDPSISGKKDYGIVQQLYETIASVKPIGYHGLLYSNIILSGGTAKLKGLKERFAANIDGYSPKLSKINVSLATDLPDLEGGEEEEDEEGYVSTSTHDKSDINNERTDVALAAFKGATILAQRPDFASFLVEREDRPFLRRNRSGASVRSLRSSYRQSSVYLTPNLIVEDV